MNRRREHRAKRNAEWVRVKLFCIAPALATAILSGLFQPALATQHSGTGSARDPLAACVGWAGAFLSAPSTPDALCTEAFRKDGPASSQPYGSRQLHASHRPLCGPSLPSASSPCGLERPVETLRARTRLACTLALLAPQRSGFHPFSAACGGSCMPDASALSKTVRPCVSRSARLSPPTPPKDHLVTLHWQHSSKHNVR